MTTLAPILIPLLLAILYYFWRQVAGLSMQDLFKRSASEHLRIHKMIAKHPDGGNWQDFQRWTGEAT
jgi:hypothetical protein